ncbi:MAG: serine/threonine-protein kinase [Dokdonella sp.]
MSQPGAMATSDWQRLRAVFAAALEIDASERDAWIATHCAGDETLLEDVRRLLTAHASTDCTLDQGSTLFAQMIAAITLDEHCVDPRIGTQIGPYRLLRLLGRGGMGSVYLAERADGQFRQNVALKLIQDDTPARAVLERFLRERDILARLSHPNIAQLHDGGVSTDGLPYFTLEVVAGEPITQWCDARRLGIRSRIDVLLKVCDAVQYAHRNLVVHRDLKPSNILVNAAGEPKLLDFGIAKFLDTTASASMTDAHAGPMTREYAAPEQVLAQPVTTLTDVYALGVLLYELLCGQLPYRRAVRGEISWPKAIVEEAPEPPSRAVWRSSTVRELASDMESALPAVHDTDANTLAARRDLTPQSLRRTLRGDLDLIVQRALEKTPEARYPSAAAFADALNSYQQGLALPGGDARYRMLKFLRRHAAAAAVMSTLALVVLAGIAGMLWEARQTALAGRRAQAIQQFMTSVFDVSDPDRAQGQTITARELLDEGARRVQTELVDQPQLQVDLLRLIGTLYFHLGLYADAERLQTQAIVLLRKLEPRGDALAATLVEVADTERLQERYAEAEHHLAEALELEPDTRNDAVRAQALASRGALLGEMGRNDEAEHALRDALALDRRMHPAPDERTATDQERLAHVLETRAPGDEARQLLNDSLQQRRRLHGERHSTVAETLEELAKLAWSRGDIAGAEHDFSAALEIRRALFGPHHPSVADSLYWIGGLRSYQGRYAEAAAAANEALEIDRTAFGTGSAHDAPYHDLLAEVAQANNDLDRAEQEARTAIDIWRRVLGEHHSEMSNGLQRLALIERDRGNAAEAVGLLREAVQIRRASLGPNSDRVGFGLANLAETLRINGDIAEAIKTFGEALDVYKASLPPEHPRVVETLSGLGHAQLDGGDVSAAIDTLEHALSIARKVYPATHPDRVRVLLPLGEAYLAHHEAARAIDVLEQARTLIAASGASHVRNAVQTFIALARAHTVLQRYGDADADLDAAHALLSAHSQGTEALNASFQKARHALDAARAHPLQALR